MHTMKIRDTVVDVPIITEEIKYEEVIVEQEVKVVFRKGFKCGSVKVRNGAKRCHNV